MSDNNGFSLQDVLKLGTEIGTEIGLKIALEEIHRYRFENLKIMSDSRLRNTKMLLENYHAFIYHCKNAVYEKNSLRAIDILGELEGLGCEKKELVIESIKRSTERTYVMVKHIKKMVERYKWFTISSKRPEEIRKYEIIFNLYIAKDRCTNEELAKKMNLDVRSLRRDKNLAIEQLSVFMFGADGLKMG